MINRPISISIARSAGLTLALLIAGAPVSAFAAKAKHPVVVSQPATVASEIGAQAREPELSGFYATRQYRPLWLGADGSLRPAATAFLELIGSAELDEVDGYTIGFDNLKAATSRLSTDRSPQAIGQAEVALSRSFAAYVRATRTARAATMLYEHDTLKANAPDVRGVLEAAAAAPSLDDYVARMAWMHPLYAPVRQALSSASTFEERQVLEGNLERIRAIPSAPAKRYVLVDAASATLWMYENDRAVDSMRVVVGKPELQTPMMAGYIRYAILNPYWNVPPDLIRKNIAPNVIRGGAAYLRNGRYEVLSDWTPDAQPIDPMTVDWKKVAAGDEEVRVRQLPGGSNFMGKVKYEFPNKLGIYLHDTPEKNLMLKDARQLSSGCIRLEDADRLGRWLMQAPLPEQVAGMEQRVDLPEIVPVYVTYLTAHPQGGQVALGPDPYRRDRAARALAQAGTEIQTARK